MSTVSTVSMLRRADTGILGILLLLACPFAAQAASSQIIDRMVAVVDGEVVTQSDIEDYRTLAQGFGDTVSGDDSVVLDQFVEDILIAKQIAQFPGNAIRQEDLDDYIARFTNTGELPRERLETLARRRLELERYYQSLGRSLRATEAETRDLYVNEFVPDWEARGDGPVPSFSEVRSSLEAIVVADKLVREISSRVESLYRRYEVEIVEQMEQVE